MDLVGRVDIIYRIASWLSHLMEQARVCPQRRAEQRKIVMTSISPLFLLCIVFTFWTAKCCGHFLSALKTNINVDVVCMKGAYSKHWVVSYLRANFKSRAWCGDWHQYLELLNASTIYNRETLVVLPSYALRRSNLLRLVSSKVYDYPLTTWILIESHGNPLEDAAWRHELLCRVVVVWQHAASVAKDRFWNCKLRRTIGRMQLLKDLLRDKNRPSEFKKIASRPLKLGCTSHGGPNATCRYKSMTLIKKVLKVLNVTFETVSVADHEWMDELISKRFDVLDANIVFSEHRRAHIFYPAYLYHNEAVYYVGATATMHNSVHLNSSLAEFLALLVAAAVVCLACFCFINYRHRRPLGRDIEGIGMVLVATVLGFPYPAPGSFERSTFGRTILFFWLLGGTSLTIFFQSLLTSSASHGVRWEADNTHEKLVPILVAGAVSVCVERPLFHGSLLEQRVNDSDFLGHMARAFRRKPTKMETADKCFNLATKRTHVFLTFEHSPCNLEKYGQRIVRGKETMHPTFGSTPVRKDFPLRAEFVALNRRLVETGLRKHHAAWEKGDCSFVEQADESEVPLDVRHFITLYLAGCMVALVVFVLEWVARLTHV